MQENYYKNIVSTKAFLPVVRHLIAGYVRLKEIALSPLVDYFFLAEKCYENELSFVRPHYAVVENKFVCETDIPPADRSSNGLIFLYSGTIAEEYGVFDAIAFIDALREYIPHLQLKIVGHCPNSSTFTKLLKTIENKPFIILIGGNEIVPHSQIISELKAADFAVLPYRLNTYYSDRIPTKLYECIALGKPMILRKNHAWRFLFDEFDGFIFTDFSTPDPDEIARISSTNFFTKGNAKMALWDSEKSKVTEAVEKLLNN